MTTKFRPKAGRSRQRTIFVIPGRTYKLVIPKRGKSIKVKTKRVVRKVKIPEKKR